MPEAQNTRPNPYVGPRAFERGETLYGRQRELLDLLDLLIAERIVLLHSPSGAGKTSLIQAALVPELEDEGFDVLPPMRVNTEPPDRLDVVNRYVFSLLLSLEENVPAEQQLPETELAGMTLVEYLDRRPSPEDIDGEVLIFDQFEEILTIDPTDRADKRAFFTQVGEALRDRRRWALFALREEFVAGLDPYLRPVPTRLSTRYRLELLGEHAALEAIQKPAADAGVDFTHPAAQKLVDDLRTVHVQEPDGTTRATLGLHVEPVQLQVVCRRLWERLPPDDWDIDETEVEAIGDVSIALRGYYADRVAAIAEETGVRERAIRNWVDRELITEQGIRGQVLQGAETSNGLPNAAIWPLVDAHLVRAEKRRGATWFELAHDRLIEPVREDNEAWREANLSTLQQQAALWQREGRPAGLLLRDEALEEAEQWEAAYDEELEQHESEFLNASREARGVRRQRYLLFGGGALIIVFASIAVIALFLFRSSEAARFQAEAAEATAIAERELAEDVRALAERQEVLAEHARATAEADALIARDAEEIAKRRQREAFLSRLAAQAVINLESYPQRSLLLAIEAVQRSMDLEQHIHSSTVETLRRIVESTGGITLSYGDWAITNVAFSADSQRLASASGSGRVEVWNVTSEELLVTLEGHEGFINDVTVSPGQSSRLVTVGQDGTVRLWDMRSGTVLTVLAHDEAVTHATFSPQGQTIMTVSGDLGGDHTVRLWDSGSGELIVTYKDTDTRISTVDFSPDGNWLAIGTRTKGIQLLDTTTLDVIAVQGPSAISDIAFSPNGNIIAVGSPNDAFLWRMANLDATPRALGVTSPILNIAFSPDGSQLITAVDDVSNIALVWELDAVLQSVSDQSSEPLPIGDIEAGGPLLTAFSPDGRWLATAGGLDHFVRVWNLRDSSFHILRGHESEGTIEAMQFSPDGRWLATGSWDNTVRLWDISVLLAEGYSTKIAEMTVEELIHVACRRAGRNLSPNEWERYLPSEQYGVTCG